MNKILVMEFASIKADLKSDLPYDKALGECEGAKNIALSKGDIVAAGHASKGLAECYRRLGLIDKAFQEYQTSLSFFQETNDANGFAWTTWAAANLKRQQCDFIGSTQSLIDAHKHSLAFKDYRCAAYALAGIAENTRILGDYKISIWQHHMAFRMFKTLQDYRGIVWSYEGLAQMYKICGAIRESCQLLTVARRIAAEVKDMRGLGFALKGIGEIKGLIGQYNDGINHLNMALAVFDEIKFKIGLAYTHKSLGDLYASCDKLEIAMISYNNALQIFQSSKDQRGQAYVFKGMGDIKKKLGFTKEAFTYYHDSWKFFAEKKIQYGLFLTSTALLKFKPRVFNAANI